MPSAYDDLLQGIGSAAPTPPAGSASAFDDLYPPAQEPEQIGYTRGRWQGTKPPSLSGMTEAFGREIAEQVMRFGRGLGQAYNVLPFGDPEERKRISERLAAEEAAGEAEMAPYRQEHPMATGLGQGAPYALMPQRALPAMLGGALWEGLKYGSPGERGGAAAGGALASGLGNVLGNMLKFSVQPSPNNPTTLGLQGAAQRLGAPLTAGQRSLDPRTLQFEDYLRQTPFGGIPLQRVGNEQLLAVNRAAARGIGEQADNLTDDVLAAAKLRIKGYYDDVTARTTLFPHPEIAQELKDFRSAIKTDVEGTTQKIMEQQIDKYTDKLLANGGHMPGKVFQSLQSQLKEIGARNDQTGMYANKLIDIFRRGMERNISAEDKALWSLANQQYRDYKRITDKAFAVNSVTGQVNPKAVARQLESEGDLFQRGMLTGPMADIGYFGRGMPSTAIGSQTAPRYFWNQLRSDLTGGLLGGIPDYLAASLLARGGLFSAHPWIQAPLSQGLGYLGRGGAPGMIFGAMNQ
jgi:hypothetical protein